MNIKARRSWFLSMFGILFAAADAFAICNGSLQAISGAGSNAKYGFICGTGCETRYFLVQNGASSVKTTLNTRRRNSTGCGVFEDVSYAQIETVQGGNFSYVVSLDPESCSLSISTNTAVSTYERQKEYSVNHTSVCQGAGVGRAGCEGVWIDGQLQSQYLDPCSSTISTIGYTPVSTNSVSDPCEGSKTTEVYKLEEEDSRSTIVIETTSSPGFKAEYTTKLAIDRSLECARRSLANESYPLEVVPAGNAIASLALPSDKSFADSIVSRWRLAITGADPDAEYEITLNWFVSVNGSVSRYPEKRLTGGSDQLVWYYPSENGEDLEPEQGEECSYKYSKQLESFTIKEVSRSRE